MESIKLWGCNFVRNGASPSAMIKKWLLWWKPDPNSQAPRQKLPEPVLKWPNCPAPMHSRHSGPKPGSSPILPYHLEVFSVSGAVLSTPHHVFFEQ